MCLSYRDYLTDISDIFLKLKVRYETNKILNVFHMDQSTQVLGDKKQDINTEDIITFLSHIRVEAKITHKSVMKVLYLLYYTQLLSSLQRQEGF